MKTQIIIFSILILIILIGCIDGRDKAMYKKIAAVPDKCAEKKDDVCSLFSCMVDSCWCREGPDGGILKQGNTAISDAEDAKKVVRDFIGKNIRVEVKKAIKLNSIFYNVFADDAGDEVVYTVAVDGTIMKTECGV